MKPERWGSPLVQEKYREEKACDKRHPDRIIIIIIIIIILIININNNIIIIAFMHGIYTYILEKNYVPREYSVAAILLLLFMALISLVSVLNLLYFYISTFRSMCAVPNMAVFCSFLTSCFPGMLLTYFLNNLPSFLLFCIYFSARFTENGKTQSTTKDTNEEITH